MRMTLVPDSRVLDLEPGETLLLALLRQDVPISYSCQDGRCGLCRCRLTFADRISSENSLCYESAEQSDVLACQTVPSSDCLVELPNRSEVLVVPSQVTGARVIGIEGLADHVQRLRLRPFKPLHFVPGQHFEVRFSSNLSRMYSAATFPTDPELVFHIQTHHGGRASKHLINVLKTGDTVHLRGPYGNAYLRQDHSAPTLFVSSGTGLGAMSAQLRSLASSGAPHSVHVYAGFTLAEDAYGEEELKRATGKIKTLRRCERLICSGALQRGHRRGLLTDAIATDLNDLQSWRAYVFGSPHAVNATTRLLKHKGIMPNRIHAEPFHYSLI